jgi:spore germination cell wall hydrolase CwlJ-like protein
MKVYLKYVIAVISLLLLSFCGTAPVKYQLPSPAMHQLQLQEYRCFYAVVLHEAEGESLKGKQAVADTVINRLRHKDYPSSVCDVVQQHKQFSNVNKTLSKPPNRLYNASTQKVNTEVASVAYNALQKVLNGKRTEIPALFYHNHSVKPKWALKKKVVAKIGKHTFYS